MAFVAEFFIINVETGKYLISGMSDSIAYAPCSRITGCYFILDKGVLSMGVSSPKFDGKSRWVIVNKRITEKSQKIDDRYMYVSFICLL